MINLYIDFDGVIKDTISVSYKMMADLGIDIKDRKSVIEFYQKINWEDLLNNSLELNDAFMYIDKIIANQVFRPSILTTVNSLGEMIAKTNYIRSKNEDISIICVPSGIAKDKLVNAKGSILIDDYSGNLESWVKAGGIGVKYGSDDTYISINSLKDFACLGATKKLCLVK